MNLSTPSILATSCYNPGLEFRPVTRRAEIVAIVASGPSFHGVHFERLHPYVHVIAVKGAIDGLKKVDSWITVDANRRTRQHHMSANQCRGGVDYYAAVPEDFGTPLARIGWHRPPPEEHIHFLHRITADGLSDDPSIIHTGNSAYAALGLAWHMGAKKIGLFGVDGNRSPYGIGSGRPRGSLSHLPALFHAAGPQIASAGVCVRNAGHLSTYLTEPAEDIIRWLNGA